MDAMDWVNLINGIVVVATVITAATPTNADNRVLAAVLRVLNLLAGNVGKNRNADDPPKPCKIKAPFIGFVVLLVFMAGCSVPLSSNSATVTYVLEEITARHLTCAVLDADLLTEEEVADARRFAETLIRTADVLQAQTAMGDLYGLLDPKDRRMAMVKKDLETLLSLMDVNPMAVRLSSEASEHYLEQGRAIATGVLGGIDACGN